MRHTQAVTAVLWVLVAWGVLTFGAVMPWAYEPLLAVAAALGVWGWVQADRDDRRALRPLARILCGVIAVGGLQLLPLPSDWLALVSPGSDRLARAYDLEYSLADAAGRAPLHAISIAPSETGRAVLMVGALGVFVLGLSAMLPRVSTARLALGVTAIGLAVAVFGLVQRATFNGRIYWIGDPLAESANVFGPFVSRNHFAGWMLMAATLGAGYLCGQMLGVRREPGASRRQWLAAWSDRSAGNTLFALVAVTVMALSVVFTMSRGGIIGLAVALGLLATLVARRRRGWTGVAVATGLLAVLGLALAGRGVSEIVTWYGRTETLAWRLQLWRDTLPMIADFPWFGMGLSTYDVATLLYPMSDRAWHADAAHNDYLQLAAEGGLVLSVLVILAVAILGKRMYLRLSEPQPARSYCIRAGAACGVCGLAVQEFVDFSLQLPGVAVLFGLMLAVALRRSPPPERPARRPADTVVTTMKDPVTADTNQRFVASRQQVWSDVAGEAAVLDLERGVYYTLNGSGARVWHLLQTPQTIDDLAGALAEIYEVSRERCRRDVADLISRLRQCGLVEVAGGETAS